MALRTRNYPVTRVRVEDIDEVASVGGSPNYSGRIAQFDLNGRIDQLSGMGFTSAMSTATFFSFIDRGLGADYTTYSIYFPIFTEYRERFSAWTETSTGQIRGTDVEDGSPIFTGVTIGAGNLTFSDTVWDDIRITSGGFELLGTADPTQVDWQPGGSGATFRLWEFAKNDEINVTAQMPHGYKAGTNLQLHVHWTPGTYGVAQRGNYVGWKIDVTAAGYGYVFPASTTLDLADMVPSDCADHQHLISSSGTFSVPAGFAESGILIMRAYRSDTGTDDTWSETLSGRLPLLLEVDVHYQINKVGSANEIPDSSAPSNALTLAAELLTFDGDYLTFE